MATNNPKLPPQHKIGDTFTRIVQIPAEFADGHFVGWVPTCQIRDKDDALVADVACVWLEPAESTRVLQLRVANTMGWSRWAGKIVDIDVQFVRTADNEVMSTTTASFALVKDVTKGAL